MRLVKALDGMENVALANITMRSLRASHKVALDAERRAAPASFCFLTDAAAKILSTGPRGCRVVEAPPTEARVVIAAPIGLLAEGLPPRRKPFFMRVCGCSDGGRSALAAKSSAPSGALVVEACALRSHLLSATSFRAHCCS